MQFLSYSLCALIPLALSTSPSARENNVLVARLCNGGAIEIPLDREPEPQPGAPCAAKACHASSSRKRFDLGQ